MSDRKLTPIAKALIDAKRLIENPENWYPEPAFGGSDGKRLCALQAIWKIGESSAPLADSARKLFDVSSVVDVNKLGHAAVMKLYDHAIARALSEGK